LVRIAALALLEMADEFEADGFDDLEPQDAPPDEDPEADEGFDAQYQGEGYNAEVRDGPPEVCVRGILRCSARCLGPFNPFTPSQMCPHRSVDISVPPYVRICTGIRSLAQDRPCNLEAILLTL